MSQYNNNSPYGSTKFEDDGFLGPYRIRPIPVKSDDVLYEVEPQFNHRPDLLAFALYNDPKLWWVFAQRNMDLLQDPVYDLVPGLKIYIPQGPALRSLLGL